LSVQPSGLIFPVIIAIWAIYLFQHWVRRREHVATARSVDRFSEAMRVLERRSPPPMSDLSVRQPRSYAVSPARPARPEAVVKRSQAPAPKVSISMRRMAALRTTRNLHAPAGMSARRVRGLSLLAALSLALVVGPLAAASVLPWSSFAVAAAVLMADAAWLRHAAVAERATRRGKSSVHRTRPDERPTGVRTRATAGAARQPAARLSVRSEPVAAAPVAGVAEVAAPAAPAGAGVVAGAGLSGWDPVPVPPPTYTLKAKAERPEPAPAAVTERGPTRPSSFDGLVDQDELDGVLDRRAAGA
jgi:hypothetical protein